MIDAPAKTAQAPAKPKAAPRVRKAGTVPAKSIQPLPDAEPPERFASLAAEYIGLSVAAGVVIGLVIGSLLPRGAARRAGKRASALTALASEVGVALATAAIDRMGSAAEDGRERLAAAGEVAMDNAEQARGRASRLVSDASDKARDLRVTVGKRAANLMARTKH